jgi:hypothetical protein
MKVSDARNHSTEDIIVFSKQWLKIYRSVTHSVRNAVCFPTRVQDVTALKTTLGVTELFMWVKNSILLNANGIAQTHQGGYFEREETRYLHSEKT